MRRLAFLLALWSYPCTAQQIWLRVGEEGQGVLRARGKECYLITPGHVVGSQGTKAELVAEGRDRGSAVVEKRELGGDVAILRVTDGLRCADAWSSRESKRGDGEARIRFVSSSGSTRYVPVRVDSETDEWIKITGIDGSNVVRQTMSGATLEIGGRPAGMLIRVDQQPKVLGMVMSQDYLTRIVSVFFDRKSQRTARRRTSGEVNVRAEPSTRGKALELLNEGSEVDVLDEARGGNWVKVKTDEGTEGYLRKTDLAKGS